MSATPLSKVSSQKYLGLTVDDNLNLNEHVSNISASAAKVLGLVKRTLHPCKAPVREKAYQALVRPKLEYAASAWSPHTNRNINKLENIQRSAARFVKGDHRRRSSVTAMINDLGWDSLETRRTHQQLAMFYKIRNGLVNISLPQCVLPSAARTRNGSNLKFVQMPVHKDVYAFSFYPRTVRVWNSLPDHVLSSDTLPAFQSNVYSQVITPPKYIARF
jgi:ribonuclease P/MRP protein subunit RPP40